MVFEESGFRGEWLFFELRDGEGCLFEVVLKLLSWRKWRLGREKESGWRIEMSRG